MIDSVFVRGSDLRSSEPEAQPVRAAQEFPYGVTENGEAPAAYVIGAALITLVVLLWTRETAFSPLR